MDFSLFRALEVFNNFQGMDYSLFHALDWDYVIELLIIQ